MFPGDTLGPSFCESNSRARLPQASLMPTGGVDIGNVAEWIKAGCVAVGVGGNLTASAKTGDFKTITILAKQFIEKDSQRSGMTKPMKQKNCLPSARSCCVWRPPALNVFCKAHDSMRRSAEVKPTSQIALSSFGLNAVYVTALPEKNPIADAAIAELRRLGVDTSQVVRGKGRMGIYFLEAGANQRPSRVVYDRENSAIALAKPGDIDWKKAFDGAGWFHVTGITPAISASAAELALEGMRKAHEIGLTVSCDLNYRRNLWKWGKSAVGGHDGTREDFRT